MLDDASRQAATSPDDYSLTIDEAALRYEHAGHPRTTRSIQRYCAQGHLDCLRQETPFGEKYLITPASVARHIAQIEEITRATSRDTSRPFAADALAYQHRDIVRQDTTTNIDEPRPNATHVAAEENSNGGQQPPPTRHDEPRLVATSDVEPRYVARLESEVDFLRGQVATKDAQIKELSERSRETNVLIGGLQRMLSPLLGSPDPHHSGQTYDQRPQQ